MYEKDLAELLKIYPSEGPASGGSRVTLQTSLPFTVRGAARDQFACLFGDVSVKAIDANATHVTCVSPPGRGAVRVAVRVEGVKRTPNKTAAVDVVAGLRPFWRCQGSARREGAASFFGVLDAVEADVVVAVRF